MTDEPDFALLARTARALLRCGKIGPTQREIVEIVIDFSLDFTAKPSYVARFPKLDLLARMAGISRGNLHQMVFGNRRHRVKGLVDMRILRVNRQCGEYECLPSSRINPWDVEWRVPPAVAHERIQLAAGLALATDLQCTFLPVLLPNEPSLDEAITAITREAFEEQLNGPSSKIPAAGTEHIVPAAGTFRPSELIQWNSAQELKCLGSGSRNESGTGTTRNYNTGTGSSRRNWAEEEELLHEAERCLGAEFRQKHGGLVRTFSRECPVAIRLAIPEYRIHCIEKGLSPVDEVRQFQRIYRRVRKIRWGRHQRAGTTKIEAQ